MVETTPKIKIVIPDRELTESPSQIDGDLETADVKTVGYFDENISIYVITPPTVKSRVSLELSYTSTRQRIYSLEVPTFMDDERNIWKFELTIIPGKCNNELGIRAYYDELVSMQDNTLTDFEVSDVVTIAGIELISKKGLPEKTPEKQLVSSECFLPISPIFQMLFKSIRSEKILTSLELYACKKLRELKTDIVVNRVTIEIANCEVTEYSDIHYPVKLTQNVTLTLAYKLISSDTKNVKPIVALIHSTIDGFKDIVTKWTTNVDFQSSSTPVSVAPFRTASSPLLMTSPNMSKSRSASSMLFPRRAAFKFKSNSSVNLQSSSSQMFKRGLIVSVSGQTRVKLGEAFKWNIQLINKSPEKMDLVLYVQSSIKKQYEKSVPPIPIQNPHSSRQDPIPLFNNNQLVKCFYHKFNKVGLVSLSNNLRMNLEPGNLFETELQLIAIEKGLFNLHDVKILDANTGDTFECPRLLDVLVV
ncbi:DEKNAAC100731 [Brettanomyces naardenensis]|uniref:DEKNAAC100731 n=1 Tax=Brettanomyces naardenensis TaxID=13370 RepID=A0A448YG88_BRENA|nr:DEKNAAC100731 [Brettanomyces naardenensis]